MAQRIFYGHIRPLVSLLGGLALALWLWGQAAVVEAVPAKIYPDMTVSNQNSDFITDATLRKPGGIKYLASLGLTDTTSYSPHQTFTNTGNVSVANFTYGSTAVLYLIANDNPSIAIQNQGDLSFSLGNNDNIMWAGAFWTDGNLTNTGDITINVAKQAPFYYAFVYGMVNNGSGTTLVNSGDISMDVQAGTVVGSNSAMASTWAIDFTGSTITNSGDITIVGRGGDITGSSTQAYATVYGAAVRGNFTNSGNISVTAVAGKHRTNTSSPYIGDDAKAYGIYVSGNLTLYSSGLIDVAAQSAPGVGGGTQSAYQVYVNAGNTTVNGYAMRLSSQSQLTTTYDGTIKVNSGAGLAFNNAVLHLCICNNFSGETDYEIPMLVEGAVVADQFASLGPVPPEYQVALIDGNGTTAQKLQFTYAPEDDPAMIATDILNSFDARKHSMIRSNVSQEMVRRLVPVVNPDVDFMAPPASLMANLGWGKNPFSQGMLQGKNKVFAGPVYLSSSDGSDNGYEADTHGILTGYTRHLDDNFYLGAHAGISRIKIHFTGAGADQRYEETDNYSLGAHALYLVDDTWLFSGLVSTFYGDTDYRDEAPSNLETADYDSHTVLADVAVGRIWDLGRLVLLPEVMLSTSWNYRKAFTTDNRINADVRHGSMEEVEVYARLNLEAYTRFQWESELDVVPNVGLGITRTLTDGNSESTMGVGQVTRHVTHHAHRTVLNPSVSLALEQGNSSLLAGFSGAFTRDAQNYLFWLELGVSF